MAFSWQEYQKVRAVQFRRGLIGAGLSEGVSTDSPTIPTGSKTREASLDEDAEELLVQPAACLQPKTLCFQSSQNML
jgi:hypothetical protein